MIQDAASAADDIESGEAKASDSGGDTISEEETEAPSEPKHSPNAPEFSEHAFFDGYTTPSPPSTMKSPLPKNSSHPKNSRGFTRSCGKIRAYHTVSSRLATRLQRLLMAQQTRQWIYELDDGMIDNARLARVVARPDITDIYKQENDAPFRDTVVSLLIDNSGSMRGRPITIAALSADILARTLERCGVVRF